MEHDMSEIRRLRPKECDHEAITLLRDYFTAAYSHFQVKEIPEMIAERDTATRALDDLERLIKANAL
jgi:hypothetical protein